MRDTWACFDTHTVYEYIFDKEPKVGLCNKLFFSVTGLAVKSNTKDLVSSLFSIPPFILYLR